VDVDEAQMAAFRRHERAARPLGADVFVTKIEALLGGRLRPQKPGPKPKDKQGIPGNPVLAFCHRIGCPVVVILV
jgi:hypothetical protein